MEGPWVRRGRGTEEARENKEREDEEKEGEVWAEMRRLACGSGAADSCRNSLLLLH